jgi:hypothetical protein
VQVSGLEEDSRFNDLGKNGVEGRLGCSNGLEDRFTLEWLEERSLPEKIDGLRLMVEYNPDEDL